jgi:hypothetical protein
MAYKCPRCGDPVHRGGSAAAGQAGAVGALLGAAFGSFQCKKCGTIPKREFAPEVRSQMTMGSVTLVVVALLLLVGVIALLVYLESLRQ